MKLKFLIMLAACGLLALTSCAGDTESKEAMNNQLAHDRIVELIQATADGLPWSSKFVTRYPGMPNAILGEAPGPCTSDDYGSPDQPYNWTFGMWLLVPGAMSPAQVRAAVVEVWRGDGIRVKGDHDVVGETKDGFTLTMLAKSDDVSLRVSSPCFPQSELDRTTSWPETITAQTDQ